MTDLHTSFLKHQMKKKAQSLFKFNLGDTVRIDEDHALGVIETIEIFGDRSEYTVRIYDEEGDVEEEYSNLEEDQIEAMASSDTETQPPKFLIGTKVKIVGDHKLAGAFGTIGYMYNRFLTEDDREWGAEGDITGWRYVVDVEGGLGGRVDSSESIEVENLVALSDQEYAAGAGGASAPPLASEDDLILE